MQSESQVSAIAHAIQSSVAPVFLLSGVAPMLAVLTNRVGRIIDLALSLEAQVPDAEPARRTKLHDQLSLLSKPQSILTAGRDAKTQSMNSAKTSDVEISRVDIPAYLRRINYSGAPAIDALTLQRLQVAHLLSVPFENLSIHRSLLSRGSP